MDLLVLQQRQISLAEVAITAEETCSFCNVTDMPRGRSHHNKCTCSFCNVLNSPLLAEKPPVASALGRYAKCHAGDFHYATPVRNESRKSIPSHHLVLDNVALFRDVDTVEELPES